MVNKLLKYEFKYYFRIMIFYIPIIIIVGLLGRFSQFFIFDIDDKYGIIDAFNYTIVSSSIMTLILTSVAGGLFTTILGIVRFYKNLYSSDGYLTFTLPISNSKQLFAKLFSYFVCQLIAAAAATLAFLIYFCTSKAFFEILWNLLNVLYEVFKSVYNNYSIVEIFTWLLKNLNIFIHVSIHIGEYLILLICGNVVNILIYYTCISIGQLVNKGRILLSIGVYYGYQWITQNIGNFIYYAMYAFLLFSTLPIFSEVFRFITEVVKFGGFWILHIILIGSILLSAGIICLLYFINVYIMNKKLNLE